MDVKKQSTILQPLLPPAHQRDVLRIPWDLWGGGDIKITGWDFVLEQDSIVLVSATKKPILSADNKGFWLQVDLLLLIKLKEDKRSREEENYPPQVFLW